MAKINGIPVTATGLGLMSLTIVDEKQLPKDDKIAVMKASIPTDGSVVVWNGGFFYNLPSEPLANIKLIHDYFVKYPEDADKVFLCVKGGMNFGETIFPDNSKEWLTMNIETILQVLDGVKQLDMFCIARVDYDHFEEGVKCMGEHIAKGNIKSWCLSECNAETFKKAHSIVPLGAVEIEYSVWERGSVKNGLVKALADAGVTMVAYSPLGKGYLAGVYKPGSIPSDPFAHMFDRLKPENIDKNYAVVELLQKIADNHPKATPSQVALEWLRKSSETPGHPSIIPIPGTSKPSRVEENTARVDLTSEEFDNITKFMDTFEVSGGRYNAGARHQLNR